MSFGRFSGFGQRRRVVDAMRWHALIELASAAYLYVNLFASPRYPILLGGDQVHFWMDAQRLLAGEVIYRDFYQYTPPGVDLVFAASFKMLGARIWVCNVVVLALGIALAALCFSLARHLMSKASAAAVTGVYVVAIYGRMLNATQHWFAVLLILIAVRILMADVTRGRVAASGVFLGLATFFNHAHGLAALVAFVVFLLCTSARGKLTLGRAAGLVLALVLTFAAVVLALSAYYLETAGFSRLWACLVDSVFRSVADLPRTYGLPAQVGAETVGMVFPYLLVYSLLPLIYGLSLWRCYRRRGDDSFPWNSIALLSVVGLVLLIEVSMSPNVLRVFAIAMPGVVLAAWMVAAWAVQRMRFSRRVLVAAILIAPGAMGGYQIVARHEGASVRGELPGGKLATTPILYEKLRWLGDHTQPRESFLQAGWPSDYLPLQVRNPLYLPTLSRWDEVGGREIEAAVEQMRRQQVRYVLWTPHLDEGCPFFACRDYLSPFREYLKASYEPVRIFADGDVLWEKVGETQARQWNAPRSK